MLRTSCKYVLTPIIIAFLIMIGGWSNVAQAQEVDGETLQHERFLPILKFQQATKLGPKSVTECQGANEESGAWILKPYRQGTLIWQIAKENRVSYETLFHYNDLWYPTGAVTKPTGEADPNGIGNVCILNDPLEWASWGDGTEAEEVYQIPEGRSVLQGQYVLALPAGLLATADDLPSWMGPSVGVSKTGIKLFRIVPWVSTLIASLEVGFHLNDLYQQEVIFPPSVKFLTLYSATGVSEYFMDVHKTPSFTQKYWLTWYTEGNAQTIPAEFADNVVALISRADGQGFVITDERIPGDKTLDTAYVWEVLTIATSTLVAEQDIDRTPIKDLTIDKLVQQIENNYEERPIAVDPRGECVRRLDVSDFHDAVNSAIAVGYTSKELMDELRVLALDVFAAQQRIYEVMDDWYEAPQGERTDYSEAELLSIDTVRPGLHGSLGFFCVVPNVGINPIGDWIVSGMVPYSHKVPGEHFAFPYALGNPDD